ncbi:MAG: hypothetical protein JST80_05700 [Bdellovibrionales bacterium]|nr:hypothetical protein [Bdellovibrionales bacterium]
MRACTFISKYALLLALLAVPSRAQSQPDSNSGVPSGQMQPSVPTGAKKDEPTLFDQYSPYLDYGDFNSSEEEDSDTLYFQYGRFFGISLGLGYETATGNRGLLYDAALPRFDLKVHYWFDFQFAMAMGIWFATHTFEYNNNANSVKLTGYYIDLKYYFDVRNASSVITFANPHLLIGFGAISKTETHSAASFTPGNDSTLSLSFGAGFEFPIVYKKTYFILDMRYWTQSFQDTDEVDRYKDRVPDLQGGFFTLMGHFMFTW